MLYVNLGQKKKRSFVLGINVSCDHNFYKKPLGALFYTTLATFSTIYLVMCKVYTDVGGIK